MGDLVNLCLYRKKKEDEAEAREAIRLAREEEESKRELEDLESLIQSVFTKLSHTYDKSGVYEPGYTLKDFHWYTDEPEKGYGYWTHEPEYFSCYSDEETWDDDEKR